MRVSIIFFLLVISTSKVLSEELHNPEPHKITFLDDSKTGFRLSKRLLSSMMVLMLHKLL